MPQLFLKVELHLCRSATLRRARDALEHGTDLFLDEKHYSLVRDAVPARRLRPSNICARGEPAAAFAQMLLDRLDIARGGSQSSTRQGISGGAVPSADSAIYRLDLL